MRPRRSPCPTKGFSRTVGGLGGAVLGLVARFPLDVAADAGNLVARDGLVRQYGRDGAVEVVAGDWLVVARPTGIELAPVDQPALAVEEEKVRSAGGPEHVSDLLG